MPILAFMRFTHTRFARSRAVSIAASVLVAAVSLLHVSARADTRLPTANLVIVAADDLVDPTLEDARITYVFEIDNFSTDLVSDVVVHTSTPEGTTFVSATSSSGDCTTPEVGTAGPIECSIDRIPPAGTVSIEVVVDNQAPAGTTVLFEASVEGSNGFERTVTQPTFVVNEGDPVLRWDGPGILPGGRLTPPRLLHVERAAPPPFTPGGGPLVPLRPDAVFRVYRSETATVRPSPETLFLTLPGNQLNSGAISAEPGYFYAVTYEGASIDSEPSNEVSFGKGEPVIETVDVKGNRLTASGTGFDERVEVTIDGMPFVKRARVNREGTRVVTKGMLSNGMALKRYLATHRPALACYRSASGGVSCAPVAGLIFVPGLE